MMLNNTFQLSDSRELGYAFYGPESGRPVLYFHGTPSSRLEPNIISVYDIDIDKLLHQYHIRLIAIDRPGMGLSTFHKEKTFISFAHDVYQLLQYLQVQNCQLLCWSGGGPYALAMAHEFAKTIEAVYIVAGFSCSFGDENVYEQMGWNKLYFSTARKFPLLLQGTLNVISKQKINTPISQKLYDLADVDYFFLKNTDHLNQLLNFTMEEACRISSHGAVQEAALYFKPLGFSLGDVQVPVHFWWGTEDNTVTYIHAKSMEKQLPHATPHYKKGEGHVSIYIKNFKETLQIISATKMS